MSTATTMKPSLVLHRAGQAPKLDVFGVTVRPLVGGDFTQGHCAIAHIECRPGEDAPLHRHRHGEAFFVLSGQVQVRCDDTTTVLGAGDFVAIPPWAVHTFGNVGTEVATLINVGTPSGHDLFFRDADALARSGKFSPETAGELCRRHDIELVM